MPRFFCSKSSGRQRFGAAASGAVEFPDWLGALGFALPSASLRLSQRSLSLCSAGVLLGAVALSGCAAEDEPVLGGSPAKTPDASGDASAGGEPALDGGASMNGDASAGPELKVELFEGSHVFWRGGEDGENKRQIDADVDFPSGGPFEKVTLDLSVGCPEGKCDWWDRKGNLALVKNAGTDDETLIELMRFMTPYRVGADWTLDLTDLQPLLSGEWTVRVWIDTWVGTGHPNGNGWLVDASLSFIPGAPDPLPIAAQVVWGYQGVEYGNPERTVEMQLESATLEIPEEATQTKLWSVLTGHGQGNLDNCGEFCIREHSIKLAGREEGVVTRRLWRDDCATTPVPGQQGTWTLSRAGWCPGAEVLPWIEDVTDWAASGSEVTFSFEPQAYENTCRPDVAECAGCALGNTCEYNDTNHTPPILDISAVLISYR